MKKLSFIVPIYNVEKYIKDCVSSIYRQGLSDEDFEVILVNDGTEDNSFERIKDICTLHKNLFIINQENQGLSCARNTGLLYAKGDYVLFVDSDDMLAEGCVADLLELALSSDADLLVADYLRLSDEEILMYKRTNDKPCGVIKSGSQLFMEDLTPDQSYVWRTMYKRNYLLQNELKFIPGICYEDIPFTPECFLKAHVCVRVNFVLYLYRIGHCSITSNMDKKKALDLNKVIERIWDLKDMKCLSEEVRRRLIDNLFSTFSFELWCISHNKNVFIYRKEIVKDLMKRVPDIWFNNCFKQFFVSLLFRMIPDLYLRIRSICLFKK